MERDDRLSRRRVLQLTGVATPTALIAGCGGGGGAGNGNRNGGGNGGDATFQIDPDTTIEFSGQTSEWEGKDYTIGWTEGDGSGHIIEIRDDSDEVVNDLSTDTTEDPGDDQMLDFTASSEMTQYVCQPHETQMVGVLQIEGAGDSSDGNGTDGNETGGNETGGNESSE